MQTLAYLSLALFIIVVPALFAVEGVRRWRKKRRNRARRRTRAERRARLAALRDNASAEGASDSV